MSRILTKLSFAPVGRWNTVQLFARIQQTALPTTPTHRLLSSLQPCPRPRLRAPKAPTYTLRPQVRYNSTRQRVNEAKEKVKERTQDAKDKAQEKAQSVGDKLKKLSKEYGWLALGVYLGLSAVDFPLCFLLVRVAGAERIGHMEHMVVSSVASVIPDPVKNLYNEYKFRKADKRDVEKEKAENHGASLGTQLALAYAIHKSLIFIRVPLTAAVLPKIGRILRSRGYNVGTKPGSH